MSKGKFALGALFGAAVGIVAGILTAPKSGKETRAELKSKAEDAKKKADKAIAEAKVKGQHVYDEVRGQADEHFQGAKSTVVDYAERVKRAAVSAKEELDREQHNGHKKD